MALPAYVIQRDIQGNSDFENVVLLKVEGNLETLLFWDWLEDLDKAAYDPYSVEVDIIAALRAATYRNQSLYDYLKFAIVEHVIRNSIYPPRPYPNEEVISRVFNPALNANRVGKYSPNSALSTYSSTNVFSYISSYGPSRFRDDLKIVGSGSVSSFEGKIRMNTGTTPGSSVLNETVEHGRYVPGTNADAAVAVFIQESFVGDQYVEAGLGNDSDRAVFHINAATNSIKVYRGGVLVHDVPQVDWNINKCDGTEPNHGGIAINLDPEARGYIFNVSYSWYGLGKIFFSISAPIREAAEALTEIPVHEFIPDGDTVIDPNLPVRVEISNGTTSNDISVDIGGRRFDVNGEFAPETRVTTTIVPLTALALRRSVFSVRKKSDFPNVGRENTVPVYLTNIEVSADAEGFVRAYIAPRDTIVGGVWVKPPEIISDSETSIEVNFAIEDVTAAPNRETSFGPLLVLGATPQKVKIPNVKGSRVPIVNSEEFIIEYDPTASSTGYVIIEFTEEW